MNTILKVIMIIIFIVLIFSLGNSWGQFRVSENIKAMGYHIYKHGKGKNLIIGKVITDKELLNNYLKDK